MYHLVLVLLVQLALGVHHLGLNPYADDVLHLTVPLDRLDVKAADIAAIKELWTGAAVQLTAQGIACEVPGKDARIYRLARK